MNINDPSTQLLYSTTRITVRKTSGENVTGTGFFYSYSVDNKGRSIPLLVSNKHVLGEIEEGSFKLSLREGNTPSGKAIDIHFDRQLVTAAESTNIDLAVIPIAPGLNALDQIGRHVFLKTIDQSLVPNRQKRDELSALEEITFIGYPNGIFDSVNNVPIIRKGITATPVWNNFEGRREFLIDAGVFEGSSGSPVFIFNQGSYPTPNGVVVGSRLFFVGMIRGTVKDKIEGRNYLDLGVVINSEAVRDEIELIAKKLI